MHVISSHKLEPFLPLFVEDLSEAQLAKAEEHMRPGCLSKNGFLTESQSLKELIQNDNATLAKHQITHSQIADCLDVIIQKYFALSHQMTCKNVDKIPCIAGTYLVQEIEAAGDTGYQLCPLFFTERKNGLDCSQNKGRFDFMVTNLHTGKKINFPSLMPHLIRDHHFFEGGFYRLDPLSAISFFEITPHTEYKLKTQRQSFWSFAGMSGGISIQDVLFAKKTACECRVIQEGIEAYIVRGCDAKKNVIDMNAVDLLANLKENETYLFLTSKKEEPEKIFEISGALFNDHLFYGSSIFNLQVQAKVVLEEDDYLANDPHTQSRA